jgi:mono/diheme cytochrome c family protein
MRAFKIVLKIIGIIMAVILLAAGGFAAYIHFTGIPKYPVQKVDMTVVVTPEKVARGKAISSMLCTECHLDRATGRLSGQHMADVPAEFGTIYSRNITQDPDKGIGGWTDGEIAHLLRTGIGRDGQYIPPYMAKLPRLADADIEAIIAFLRSDDSLVMPSSAEPPPSQPSFLVKFLSRVAFKPFPYPTAPQSAPPLTDKVAYGKYLVQDFLDCYACHSASFKTMDAVHPERSAGYLGGGNPMQDLAGNIVYTANLTPDVETGIGGWSEEDFVRAVREGVAPGRALRYPMPSYAALAPGEVQAIYAYLQTVPAIHNPLDRGLAVSVPEGDGAGLFKKYGCVSCHGETGKASGDLTKANADFPTDEALRAWIENPAAIRPGVKMPAFSGIVAPGDYPALIAHVRQLAAAAP